MGLDRFMVLKFLRMGMVTFLLYSLVAIPILFPINTINQGSLSGLNYLTMGNVTDDKRTWAHCLLACILSCLVWYYTFRETRIYISLRRKYLMSPEYANSVAARTLFVPSIPPNINHAKDLEKIFNRFPGGVRRIWLNRKVDDLPDLVQDRQKSALSLESVITKAILATYKHRMKAEKKNRVMEEGLTDSDIPHEVRPQHRDSPLPIPLPCFGQKVDSIDFYHQKLKELNKTIGQKQTEAIQLSQANSAFIEFNDQVAAHMAAQSLLHKSPMYMAPRYIQVAPSDIIWQNTNIRSHERMIRRFLSFAATTAIIVFWAAPVVFVQAVANIETLSKALPFLSGINNLGPTAVGIIQGILPAVALSILIALVPIIFTILSTQEGIPQRSFVELSLLHKFFFFQLIDVVLISTVSAGVMTMAEQLANLAQNPFGIINILSVNLPKASTFFITFVMLQATNQSGQTLLQIVPFILSFVMPLLNTTPRDIYNRKKTCPNINLGTLIPSQTVIFILGLEYGVIAPLILPFVCLFFVLQYFVYLYQFLYVYELSYETAGRAFPRAIRHIYIGLLISQLTLIGLFAIRSGARGQMALMIVCLILTSFALFYYDRAFKPLFKYLPVSIFEDNEPVRTKQDDLQQEEESPSVYEDTHKLQVSTTHSGNSQPEETASIQPHSSIHSDHENKTPVEAYEARKYLIEQLHQQQQKDKELIRKDQKHIIRMAKELYETEAYMHPSTYSPEPIVWLPEDEYGIAKDNIQRLEADDIEATSRSAVIVRNRKNKPVVTIDEERLIDQAEGAPGANPSAVNYSDVNDYVRVLVDSYNFADAITMF
ncbi:hypothetical protein BD560DRAFT_410599 [Blakeslea trispora]|nr:hypothetical protein BD560DRAFT_410599 [Blakeslea trispora]